jgi:catechol 2,3-dioxygenase-like lactoylglutathione lyase family enzyme
VGVLGLDHVQLAAPEGAEDEARSFFGDTLGLGEIEKPDALRDRGGVWFRCGAQQLHVGIEPAFTPAHKAHPGLRVQPHELDALADRLRLAGAQVHWDQRRTIPGARRFHTFDPWGNRIELIAWDDA